MDRIDVDTTFAHAFDFKLLDERPGHPALTYFYPGARTDGGRDGVLIRFVTDSRPPWIGVFAWGYGGKTSLYTHPDPARLCVVAQGVGYIVHVDEPTHWLEIAAVPIVDMCAVPQEGLLVFATNTGLIAYDSNGPRWETERLALDEIQIIGSEGVHIYLCANRYAADAVKVTVNAKTGITDIRPPW